MRPGMPFYLVLNYQDGSLILVLIFVFSFYLDIPRLASLIFSTKKGLVEVDIHLIPRVHP